MTSKLSVYIADDSELVRERLQAQLSEMDGIDLVGQCGDALTAIEAIGRLNPDVVIMDIRMPGAKGTQALTAIKQGERPPVVIMLTAFAYSQYRIKYLAAGADYFFDKTTEFDGVFAVLERLLNAQASSAQP